VTAKVIRAVGRQFVLVWHFGKAQQEFQSAYADATGNKRQFLAAVKSDPTKTESWAISDMKALVLGDRAIVDGISTIKSSLAGKDTSGQSRFTDMWVKRDGKWLCVTGYATKIQ
jgi:hypothetical protein